MIFTGDVQGNYAKSLPDNVRWSLIKKTVKKQKYTDGAVQLYASDTCCVSQKKKSVSQFFLVYLLHKLFHF